MPFKKLLIEFFIIWVIFLILFIIYNNLLVEKQCSIGTYECKTFLPSFRGNSINVTLTDGRKRYRFNLGRIQANLFLYTDHYEIKVRIFFKNISNIDEFFFYDFKELREKYLDVIAYGNNLEVKYYNNFYETKSTIRLKCYQLFAKEFIKLHLDVYDIYSNGKGILRLTKKLYIENIKMNLYLIKKTGN